MYRRILTPQKNRSFFLFGARGTGKSTYLSQQWSEPHHTINLLLNQPERRYSKDPDLLIADLNAIKPQPPAWVVIDEVQKIPKLLDTVQEIIERKKIKFALTGSSARKLKRQFANLLAGRAFYYQLFPLTARELGTDFDLEIVLHWGALPSIFGMSNSEREEYLKAYAQTYLKEEILQEQIVRSGASFRNFLEIAAQENGKTINFTKIAKDVGVDTKTIQSFFQVLEDTWLGTLIPGFSRSTRKSTQHRPKFYLFDLGVKRAMEHALDVPLRTGTAAYGEAFEHFLIQGTVDWGVVFADYE